MAAIKVYGSVVSTATMKVTAALYEKGLEFEFIQVDMRSGEHKKEPFLSLNPFGQVPAFEDGDLKLFGKYPDPHYSNHQYDPVASKLVWELGAKPFFGMVTDNAVVEENEAKLGKVLDVYEARLSESKYLGGDAFTIADLHHLPSVMYLMATKVQNLFESRPHVSAWVKDITARPSLEEAIIRILEGVVTTPLADLCSMKQWLLPLCNSFIC